MVWIFPGLHFSLPTGATVALHILFEVGSIIISVMVFSIGWHAIARDRPSSVLAVASGAFLGVALLDFLHMLTYQGMPVFHEPYSLDQAIAFFLAARLLAALAILAIAVVPANRDFRPGTRHAVLLLSTLFAAGVGGIGMYAPDLLPVYIVPGTGLTAAKIWSEVFIAGLNIAAAIAFSLRLRDPGAPASAQLWAAAGVMALSEFAFTLYATTTDQFVHLAHLYKVIAYALIYRAVFVEGILHPFRQVRDSEEQLKRAAETNSLLSAVVANSRDAIVTRGLDNRILTWNAAAQQMFGYTAEEAIGCDSLMLVPPEHLEEARRNRQMTRDGGGILDLDTERLTRDGRYIDISLRLSPITAGDGQMLGASMVFRDIAGQKLAQKKLQESEAFNIAVLDSLNEQIAVLDADGNIVTVNSAWKSFALANGAPQGLVNPIGVNYLRACEKATGMPMGEEAPAALAGIRSVLEGGQPTFQLEYPCHSPMEQRWFRLRVTPFRNAGAGVVISHENITSRKLANAALRESEQRYRALVERSREGVAVHRHGRLVYVNPALVEMFGARSARELVGRPSLDLVHPEDRPLVAARLRSLTGSDAATPLATIRNLRLDGTTLYAESLSEMITFDGQPSVLTVIRDISEQRRMLETQTRLAAIVESSNDAIISRSMDGEILSWNAGAEKMLGYTAAEIVGSKMSRILPPNHVRQLENNNEALREGRVLTRESQRMTRDGRVLDVLSSHSAIRDAAGNIVGISIILQDITARKKAEAERATLEDQLRESQKMQAVGTLAGGIAHDFNNIIAAILGNAELALQDVATNPQATRASLDEINNAARRARDLVQQILAFSRRQPAERKPLQLSGIVEESARLLRATLPARISLDLRCAADLPPVLADATQVQQVLLNLATNAMQAIGNVPGRICIEVDEAPGPDAAAPGHPALVELLNARPDRYLRLSVTDTGPGMDKATQERIFEPFFTTKPVGQGTGLGLSVVHGIVQSHLGAIAVRSQPGEGTRFTVYLPAMPPGDAQSPADQGAAMPGGATAGSGTRHVLYLDDDPFLVRLVKRLLERRGLRVTVFMKQAEALAALRAAPAAYDLVISDYNMPGMSGLDVAREVRSIRANLPVAVVSGFVDEELQANARSAGVREVIFKAEAMDSFCDVVLRVLNAGEDATKAA